MAFVPRPRTAVQSIGGIDSLGASGYLTYCGSCHKHDGSGVTGSFPALLNSRVLYGQRDQLITKVLYGGKSEKFDQQMPGFAFLNDNEIAGILNYIRKNFANNQEVIQEKQVATVRAKGK
jgi:mono/diheme cytochrome c family protein